MQKLEIAICDDDKTILPYIAEKVKKKFFQYCIEVSCEIFTDGNELLEIVNKEKFFHIYFLDISMPEIDGLKLAEEILKKQPDAGIIFISARASDIFQTFFASPLAFIRKENFLEDLERAVKDFVERYEEKPAQFFWIEDDYGESMPFEINQTLFLEEQRRHICVATMKKNFFIRGSLKEIEKDLKDYHFVRIHRSCLVNIAMIYQIKKDKVILDNGAELPLSRFHAGNIKKEFARYW